MTAPFLCVKLCPSTVLSSVAREGEGLSQLYTYLKLIGNTLLPLGLSDMRYGRMNLR